MAWRSSSDGADQKSDNVRYLGRFGVHLLTKSFTVPGRVEMWRGGGGKRRLVTAHPLCRITGGIAGPGGSCPSFRREGARNVPITPDDSIMDRRAVLAQHRDRGVRWVIAKLAPLQRQGLVQQIRSARIHMAVALLRFDDHRKKYGEAASALTAWPFEMAPRYSRGVHLGAIRIWPEVAANGSFRCCHPRPGRGDAARSHGADLCERF